MSWRTAIANEIRSALLGNRANRPAVKLPVPDWKAIEELLRAEELEDQRPTRLSKEEAAAMREVLMNSMSPGGKMIIPNGWNVILRKLENAAGMR